MATLPQKCVNIDTVGAFCDCIAGEEPVDPAVQTFCNEAKTDKNITDEDLAKFKMALMELEDEACCDC
jgi:hypothetical protein